MSGRIPGFHYNGVNEQGISWLVPVVAEDWAVSKDIYGGSCHRLHVYRRRRWGRSVYDYPRCAAEMCLTNVVPKPDLTTWVENAGVFC